jgi:hypothetical protein
VTYRDAVSYEVVDIRSVAADDRYDLQVDIVEYALGHQMKETLLGTASIERVDEV